MRWVLWVCMFSCPVRDFYLFLFFLHYSVAMLIISSNIICTRNLPTFIIYKAAQGGILLFHGFSRRVPLDVVGGLAFISTQEILSSQEQSLCCFSSAESALQGCCHRGWSGWLQVGDCRSLTVRKLLSLMLCRTKGIQLWVILFLHVVDATIRQVRDGGVLLYFLEIVNNSIVILSDDVMSLENYR